MSDIDAYKTLSAAAESLYKEKGSKFIGYLFPIQSIEQFEQELIKIKKAHPKARHWCYAYKIGPEAKVYRVNDDGEPSGTAGKPIYGQLNSAEITDVACVVVRYFGGTKLGASGLIRAYKIATQDAVQQIQIITKWITEDITIHFDYGLMGTLLKALKDLKLDLAESDFGATPNLTLKVKQSELDHTIKRIKAKLLHRSVEDIEEDTNVEGIQFKPTKGTI